MFDRDRVHDTLMVTSLKRCVLTPPVLSSSVHEIDPEGCANEHKASKAQQRFDEDDQELLQLLFFMVIIIIVIFAITTIRVVPGAAQH